MTRLENTSAECAVCAICCSVLTAQQEARSSLRLATTGPRKSAATAVARLQHTATTVIFPQNTALCQDCDNRWSLNQVNKKPYLVS